jgi:hypothetical protein
MYEQGKDEFENGGNRRGKNIIIKKVFRYGESNPGLLGTSL